VVIVPINTHIFKYPRHTYNYMADLSFHVLEYKWEV
jgi:hypothetical protein